MQGFGRQFRASNFTPNTADEDAVKARGKEIAEKGFALIDKALAGKEYAVGKFSIADSAIFYTEFWSKRVGMTLPSNCAAHLERMLGRPSVQRVMQQEGLA
jgi:glutathione S-transferase